MLLFFSKYSLPDVVVVLDNCIFAWASVFLMVVVDAIGYHRYFRYYVCNSICKRTNSRLQLYVFCTFSFYDKYEEETKKKKKKKTERKQVYSYFIREMKHPTPPFNNNIFGNNANSLVDHPVEPEV
jgi:hypothetical protein